MGVTPAHQFLRALWGERPPGLLQVWQLDGRRSWYAKGVPGAASYLDGQTDAYIGVGLAHKDHGRYRRARSEQVIAVPGLWLDIDVDGGPDHKTGGVPTLDDAITLAGAVVEPTIIVCSGYGAHAWYLLDTPWRFADLAEQRAAGHASAAWYALHRAAANERGWSIDHTHDLARLLRPPGTFNGKGDKPVPVNVIAQDGPRYSRSALLELCGEAPNVGQLSLDDGGDLPVVDVGPARALDAAVLDALMANSDDFRRTWMHARTETWSMSEYDLALCSLAAPALNDQQLADLIALHRRTYDPADQKAQRPDYVQRTVAKARQAAERTADVDWFRQAASRARGVAA